MQGFSNRLYRSLKRAFLRWRIGVVRSDILVATERHQHALQSLELLDKWLDDAHRRERALKANLALLESPNKLLQEALRHE
jgi:hypothetical protein